MLTVKRQKDSYRRERKEMEARKHRNEILRKETMRTESETAFDMDISFDEEDIDPNNNDTDYSARIDSYVKWTLENVRMFLEEKLGKASVYVLQYLPEMNTKPKKRNDMAIPNTARASLRCSVSPGASAMICSEFLKDLIAAGHLSEDMSYLACDRMKVERARKLVMKDSNGEIKGITGIGYDGRKDKHTRAMITDLNGNRKLGKITEEHVSISKEPEGEYLTHFVPKDPLPGEKPV